MAAADAAEGGDGVPVAVTVAEKEKKQDMCNRLLRAFNGKATPLSLLSLFFLPVRVSVAYGIVSRVLLLVSRYIKTHFLPVALPLLPLALGRYVTLRGARLC